MRAGALIEVLRERGVHLARRGDRLYVSAPRGMLRPEDVAALRARKWEILALLDSRRTDARLHRGPVARREAIDRAYASPEWSQPGGLLRCSVCGEGTVWARREIPLHPFCAPEGEP